MCQVHTGAYVSLLAPGKNDYTVCHPRKTTTYILNVVPITTHTHVRLKSIGKKKQRKRKEEKRKEEKGKERQESAKRQEEKTEKKRKKIKKRQDEKARSKESKREKMSY